MNDVKDYIPTRRSLLSRLKDWNDQESWKSFFDTYWMLIYRSALRSGLSEAEAEDVVQETVISVSKTLATFQHNGQKGAFKAWLLRVTGWRIVDQMRRRRSEYPPVILEPKATQGTSEIDLVPDPVGHQLEASWDEEWERNLMDVAIERVKRLVEAKQYQIWDLHVIKEWPAGKVAETLHIPIGQVYMAKHRITPLIKKEIALLQTRPI
jgi:RNA polymerase sigma-70 factor (ECF subfamily)